MKISNQTPRIRHYSAMQLVSIVKEVELGFQKISEQAYDPSAIKSCLTAKFIDHSRSIVRSWKNVRPVLEPFTHDKLPRITEWK